MPKKTSKKTTRVHYDFEGAYHIIELIKGYSEKLEVLTAIALAHKEAGDMKAVKETVTELLHLFVAWKTKNATENYVKSDFANTLFREFGNLDDTPLTMAILKENVTIAEKIKDNCLRCHEYLKFAAHCCTFGEKEFAEELTLKAEKEISSIRYDRQKPVLFFSFAQRWTEMDSPQKAEQAIQSVHRIIEKLKDPSEALFGLGLYYIEQGQFRRGLDLLKKARSVIAGYLNARFTEHLSSLIKEGYEEDVREILNVLKLKRNEWQILSDEIRLAMAIFESGDKKTALSMIDAIEKEKDTTHTSFPLYLLLDFYLKGNRFAEAERALDAAKRPLVIHTSFLFDLAGYHFHRGKKSEAKRLIERAAKEGETIEENFGYRNNWLLCLAACWARFGDQDAARKIYEKMSVIHPANKRTNYMKSAKDIERNVEIAYFQWYFGFTDDAKKTIHCAMSQAAAMQNSKPAYYAGVVEVLLRLGETNTAKAIYEEIVQWLKKEGNPKGEQDNNLMNFGKGLVCRYHDGESSGSMRMLQIQED